MEKFSLFELDNIPKEELLKVYPNAKGENEFSTRINIALKLKDDGKLEDCPLFDSNKSKVKSFLFYLSLDPNQLKKIWEQSFSEVSEEFMRKHRILFVYTLQADLIISISRERTREIIYQALFESQIYYDNSYYKYIESLSDDDLNTFRLGLNVKNDFNPNDVFSSRPVEKIWISYNIDKELAKRVYDNVKYRTNITEGYGKRIYLGTLAFLREDHDMIDILNGTMMEFSQKIFYNDIYVFYPIVEVLKHIDIKVGSMMLEFVLIAISSVAGTSPYESINYKIPWIF